MDPVKHCDVYKEDGCAHVDGYLCDFETCDIRLEWAQKKNLGIKMTKNENNLEALKAELEKIQLEIGRAHV